MRTIIFHHRRYSVDYVSPLIEDFKWALICSQIILQLEQFISCLKKNCTSSLVCLTGFLIVRDFLKSYNSLTQPNSKLPWSIVRARLKTEVCCDYSEKKIFLKNDSQNISDVHCSELIWTVVGTSQTNTSIQFSLPSKSLFLLKLK
jgi:hypothetical protein